MNAPRQLHDLGQSLWLDNITRGLLTSGALGRYINDLPVTGLTSNPTILEQAIKSEDFYQDAIRSKALAGRSGERRIAAGRDARVASLASIFVSRWDVVANGKVSEALRNCLGMAIARRTYKAYRDLLASSRWKNLAASGALPQRLLWASTGTKDPAAPDVLHVEALAPDTINTMPEKTLLAFADHGEVKNAMRLDGGNADDVLAEFAREGVNCEARAAELQREGTVAFTKS